MIKVNPTKLTWQAPTTNVDGTPINYAIEYEVGIVTGDTIDVLMVVPAQLQTDTGYEAPISELGLDYGVYEIVLRTFAKDDPERVSAWSNPADFAISREIPNAPLDLRVA